MKSPTPSLISQAAGEPVAITEDMLTFGVKALLNCTMGEIECISPKMMDSYEADVARVFTAMRSAAPTTGSAPEPVHFKAKYADGTVDFCKEIDGFDPDVAEMRGGVETIGLVEIAAPPANAPVASVLNRSAFSDIVNERIRQTEQWGGVAHDDAHGSRDWFRFIAQQQEKCREAITETLNQQAWGHITNAYGEELIRGETRMRLVKIAALAIAGIESNDRIALLAASMGGDHHE